MRVLAQKTGIPSLASQSPEEGQIRFRCTQLHDQPGKQRRGETTWIVWEDMRTLFS